MISANVPMGKIFEKNLYITAIPIAFHSILMSIQKFINCFLGMLLLTGCKSIGPSAIRHGHPMFNQAVAQTLDEQLLLNIVRMRYLDTVYFLDVGSITDTRNVTLKLGTDNTKFFVHNHGKTAELNASNAFTTSQTPTVTYFPMQGQSFVKRMYAPIPLPLLLHSVQSGWNTNRVFGIFVEQINDLKNAPTASGPTPLKAPEYAEFFQFISLMTPLLKEDVLKMGVDPVEHKRLIMKINNRNEYANEIAMFRNFLDAEPSINEFSFQDNFLAMKNGDLCLRVRSIQSAMFYLSNGVQIPQNQIDSGLVTVTRHANGSVFDWSQMLGNIFQVHCSAEKPQDAYLSVFYRGYWFHIADSDINTKSTFMLLSNIFNLQAGDSQVVAPTLTIPIGGK
ncbi:MAG: hypothetical protein LBG86_00950 [Puniceicoccales bacterium]|nr:hypothetical protein [Puniceicoccales bacterium]